jgi:hypothetical protein
VECVLIEEGSVMPKAEGGLGVAQIESGGCVSKVGDWRGEIFLQLQRRATSGRAAVAGLAKTVEIRDSRRFPDYEWAREILVLLVW